MNERRISLRPEAENPNHHLWNNNGTWFVHYTTYPTSFTKERVRKSLGTKSLTEARQRRDALFASIHTERHQEDDLSLALAA